MNLRTHPDTPVCSFCWPRTNIAQSIDYTTKQPCCLACAQKADKVPTLPFFMHQHAAAMAERTLFRVDVPA